MVDVNLLPTLPGFVRMEPMPSRNSQIILLFRKRSPHFNSIEEIFHGLNSHLNVDERELPEYSGGLINKLKNVMYTSKLSCHILHITGEIYYAGLLFGGKMIVTIHDMGSLKTTNPIKRLIIKYFWFQFIARKARAITFISEFSRSEFLKEIKVDLEKVHVIHNPLPPSLKFNPKSDFPDKPSILHIGTKSNKNLPRLIRAIADLECSLTVIGQLNEEQLSLLQKYNIQYKNKVGISFHEVVEEYNNCDVVSFVSTYEGFGMPIIEAQAVGRPVLTSNLSPMKEMAGKGAVFVDPLSIEGIREGLNSIFHDDHLRGRIIALGNENIGRFQSHEIAKQYLDLYHKVEHGK